MKQTTLTIVGATCVDTTPKPDSTSINTDCDLTCASTVWGAEGYPQAEPSGYTIKASHDAAVSTVASAAARGDWCNKVAGAEGHTEASPSLSAAAEASSQSITHNRGFLMQLRNRADSWPSIEVTQFPVRNTIELQFTDPLNDEPLYIVLPPALYAEYLSAVDAIARCICMWITREQAERIVALGMCHLKLLAAWSDDYEAFPWVIEPLER